MGGRGGEDEGRGGEGRGGEGREGKRGGVEENEREERRQCWNGHKHVLQAHEK